MPVILRPAAQRGRFTDPGLTGVAAFSHGEAFDRHWLGFHALRVLNRVELAPGTRLPAARRANMEVLTLVLEGHYRVSSQAGDSGPLKAGQWHRLAAGAGVDVLEQNLDPDAPLRLLQLWLQPAHSNAPPQQAVAVPGAGDTRIAAPTDALLHWDLAATLRRLSLAPGATFAVPATPAAACWVDVIAGELAFRGPGAAGLAQLRGGDGLGVADEAGFALVSSFGAELLLLELPG